LGVKFSSPSPGAFAFSACGLAAAASAFFLAFSSASFFFF